jgi:hypothetical protein
MAKKEPADLQSTPMPDAIADTLQQPHLVSPPSDADVPALPTGPRYFVVAQQAAHTIHTPLGPVVFSIGTVAGMADADTEPWPENAPAVPFGWLRKDQRARLEVAPLLHNRAVAEITVDYLPYFQDTTRFQIVTIED